MIVVSDTSVISYLLQLKQVELLPTLFGDVLIPEAVRDELKRSDDLSSKELSAYAWLVVDKPKDQTLVKGLLNELDLGESEAIALAIEHKAAYLLIDERTGREVAVRNHLTIIGLIGILLRARQLKLIPALKPVLDELQNTNFRISQSLIKQALELEKQLG